MTSITKSKNKNHRQKAWIERKRSEGRTKREARFTRKREESQNPKLRLKRLAKNKPITIEDKRIWPEKEEVSEETEGGKGTEEKEAAPNSYDQQENVSDDDDADSWLENSDEESNSDMETSQKPIRTPDAKLNPATSSKLAALLPEIPINSEPCILITTSRHSTLHKKAEALTELFPNSTYIPRSGNRFSHDFSVHKIAHFASNRGYTALLILMEDQKKPSGLTVITLPSGPALHFSIKTWIDGKIIPGHGRPTDHIPELILNNFSTTLGQFVATVFQGLFPTQPEVVGRQVVTIHNQRDYMFLRRHRYMFGDKRPTERSITGVDGRPIAGVEDLKVRLQEIGPRLTLRLRRVEKGIQRSSEGQIWEWKPKLEKKRTVFQL
ncbi:hypothetical protein Egran_04807 [Elaphomyces granulatus]|uniref:Brix domain-containing protein n=1 Tax=Elaphomyces granulatus TaxID=519963 RepID=A0A232LTT1_9EURO|nr:hypothetical protein Egran_04807 [Elaphomyces granulatus]